MPRTTSYRKAVCAHVSEVSRLACPLCSKAPARKVRTSKYLMIFGQKVEAPKTFAAARAIVRNAKRAAGKRVKSTSPILMAVK